MKKKIKLSEICQEELKKDEMQNLVGGEVEQCKFVCSCSCSCQSNADSSNGQDSTKESSRTSGWLKEALDGYAELAANLTLIK